MNYYQEKIETDSIIPARIYIRKSKGDNCHYPLHWHNNLEFDLVLEGIIKGKINRKQIEVCVGEFLFVNSGELHETDANDRNQMSSITILLSYNLLKEYCPDIDLYYFDFVENKGAQNKVKNLIEDQRCKGGWHYGSISRSAEDIYSDYDPVFLVADKDFEHFSKDVPKILSKVSDELLIFLGESFNDEHFKNYCSVIRIGNNLHQFDFFIINAGYPEDWMCRQHLKGCTRDNIIFDKAGEVTELLDKGFRTDNYMPDPVRAMDTYWFHTEMLIKYFKRKDIFKLIKNIDVLFHSHVDLLLSQYDTLDWGAWESKVKHCVPKDKQNHLKAYFANAEFKDLEKAIKSSMYLFKQDAKEICKVKGINYPDSIAEQVISYFNKRMEEEDWE